MIHLPALVPNEHSSHIRTRVIGRTYESQMGLRVQRGPRLLKQYSPLSVALLAETANGDTGLSPAHEQI